MNTERDKFLTILIGECCHEWEEEWDTCVDMYKGTCKVCGITRWGADGMEDGPIDFYTYEGLGMLIRWLKDQDLWVKIRWNMPMAEFMDLITDPDKAADRLYKYLKEGK